MTYYFLDQWDLYSKDSFFFVIQLTVVVSPQYYVQVLRFHLYIFWRSKVFLCIRSKPLAALEIFKSHIIFELACTEEKAQQCFSLSETSKIQFNRKSITLGRLVRHYNMELCSPIHLWFRVEFFLTKTFFMGRFSYTDWAENLCFR
jgi:hypothetical protein